MPLKARVRPVGHSAEDDLGVGLLGRCAFDVAIEQESDSVMASVARNMQWTSPVGALEL